MMDGELVVHLCFLVLGACCLFPWLSFISAVDYFQLLYGQRIETLIAVVYNLPLILGTFWVTFGSAPVSVVKRTNMGLVAIALCLAAIPIVDAVHSGGAIDDLTAMSLTLAAIGGSGLATAIVQNSLYGLAAVFGRGGRFTVAMGSGQGVAEVLVVAIRVGTKLAAGPAASAAGLATSLASSTMIYFVISIFVVVVGLAMFLVMQHTAIGQKVLMRQYGVETPPPPRRGPLSVLRRVPGSPYRAVTDGKGADAALGGAAPGSGTALLGEAGQAANDYNSIRRASSGGGGGGGRHTLQRAGSLNGAPAAAAQALRAITPPPSHGSADAAEPAAAPTNPMGGGPLLARPRPVAPAGRTTGALGKGRRAHVKAVWRKVRGLCLAIFTCFIVCLGCFPGVATEMPTFAVDPDDWIPVGMTALFNLGDFVGKTSVGVRRLAITSTTTLYRCVLLHTLFIPLFLLGLHPEVLPAAFHTKWYPLTLSCLLGLSTGFLGCCGMAIVPQQVDAEDEKEIAGVVSSFSLIMGLFCGSWVGVLATQLA